ncbi:MAG: ACP S-malonyltransferase [Treponema sp.]|jgi:[acyl-carrier-protein] S-malonyltransferase|nr:ACP S-malonyltransferase [Treponema sp.]
MALQTKKIFLFPGQGTQYPGMTLDFWEKSSAVKELFALASDINGINIKALLTEADAEILKRADISQTTVTLANLSASRFMEEQGLMPDGVAGFSLGEYAALAVADVVGVEDCFRLVKVRGEVMQAAIDTIEGGAGMAAVIGLAPQTITALLAEWNIEGLFTANFNSSRQTVVSGTASALVEAEPLFKRNGAKRFVRLPVAGPFHSPLMQSAVERFAPVLEGVSFNDPHLPLYSNVTGKRITSGADAKWLALPQITSPVRWIDEEISIIADGFDVAFETGPGHTLAGFWKDMGNAIPCLAAGTVQDILDLFNNPIGC